METQPSRTLPPKRRVATLYDAVAGRVGYEGFLRHQSSSSQNFTRSSRPVPADEVLFRRAHAPTRYAEDDIYYAASRALPPSTTRGLPESDLLKTVHAYVADYYMQAIPNGDGRRSLRSFDETALLAMGILLEEAARSALGKTGDLALVEAAEEEEVEEKEEEEGERRTEPREDRVWVDGQWRRRVLRKVRVRNMDKGAPAMKREPTRSVKKRRTAGPG
nr:hypothetical protein CFP56_25939 [Quercus suber]